MPQQSRRHQQAAERAQPTQTGRDDMLRHTQEEDDRHADHDQVDAAAGQFAAGCRWIAGIDQPQQTEQKPAESEGVQENMGKGEGPERILNIDAGDDRQSPPAQRGEKQEYQRAVPQLQGVVARRAPCLPPIVPDENIPGHDIEPGEDHG